MESILIDNGHCGEVCLKICKEGEGIHSDVSPSSLRCKERGKEGTSEGR